jgi:hypothetical protein
MPLPELPPLLYAIFASFRLPLMAFRHAAMPPVFAAMPFRHCRRRFRLRHCFH